MSAKKTNIKKTIEAALQSLQGLSDHEPTRVEISLTFVAKRSVNGPMRIGHDFMDKMIVGSLKALNADDLDTLNIGEIEATHMQYKTRETAKSMRTKLKKLLNEANGKGPKT